MELTPHESQKLGECAIAVSGTTMSRDMETMLDGPSSAATIAFPPTVRRAAETASGVLRALGTDGYMCWGGAFWGSAVRRVVLPRTLKMLSSYAFANCGNLEHMMLPGGLERMGTGASRAAG